SVLDAEPFDVASGAADRLHRLLLKSRGAVLGQAVGRFDPRHRSNSGARMVQSAAACPRPDLRRRQVAQRKGEKIMGQISLQGVRKSFGPVNIIKGADLDI